MINSQVFLDRIDKHIKLLQYKLSRVVSTFADFHTLLVPNQPTVVDLIESTPIYCKVDTRYRIPPLKVTIEFKDKPVTAVGGRK